MYEVEYKDIKVKVSTENGFKGEIHYPTSFIHRTRPVVGVIEFDNINDFTEFVFELNEIMNISLNELDDSRPRN